MWKSIVLLSIISSSYSAIYYDTYKGTIMSKQELKQHDKDNNTFWCTKEIEPCDPNEGRRVDGSCNNLEHPARGAIHTPFRRVLPPVFEKVDEPRKSKSGNDLPLARRLRTSLLSQGRVPSQMFTQLATNFLVFMSGDILSQHDTVNYILWKPYCCTAKGKSDRACVPNKIPDDDPVHRFSDIRCLNMTRPNSYQTFGCLKNDTTPERIVSSTPLLDLSTIYGGSAKELSKSRKLENGLLKTENSNGKIWPPSTTSKIDVCRLNDKLHETRCHNTPDAAINTLAGINLMSILFWRYHNHIATALAKVNPCWDDDKLFNTSRDINIAHALQIYYYEILPLMLGKENLQNDGLLETSLGFRDIYNSSVLPQLSLEYPYVLRWLHTMQEGALKMYDKEGHYLRQYPVVNLTLKTGFFDVDNNIDYMTQGSFRQGSANLDYVVDPDISEIGLGPHQKASDILTNDLAKSRYFGFQPYTKYREFCSGKPIKGYNDLVDVIDPERIEILKDLYEDIEDIDIMAGIWVEKPIQGGYTPSTFYCLVVEQLMRNIVADRHWYERENRPNAYTTEQLQEIRKTTIARILCDVGDSVTKIQPQAFLRIESGNKLTNCDKIVRIDYTAWRDSTCE